MLRRQFLESSMAACAAFLPISKHGSGLSAAPPPPTIHELITAAGVGGVVTLEPNTLYVVTKAVRPLAGQTWFGNNATICRADEVVTTTSSAIVAGASPTVLNVASVDGLEVGETVTVLNGSSFDAANHEILAVGVSSITVGTKFSTAFPSGGTVVRSFETVRSDVDGFSVYNLNIDGNRAGNVTMARWEIHHELRMSHNNLAVDCVIENAQSEGVMIQGDNCIIERCQISNCNGNGIHFSGANGSKIIGSQIHHTNELSGTGHEDGCISFSRQVNDTLITGCHLHHGKSGIGGIDLHDNSNITITNCVAEQCENEAIEAIFFGTASPSTKNILITNCIFRNPVVFNNTSGFVEYGASLCKIEGNHFEGANLEIRYCSGFVASGNTLDLEGDNGTVAIHLIGARRCNVASNEVIGGAYGAYLDNGASNNTLSGNHFTNQYSGGISTGGTVVGLANSYQGNHISNNATSSGSYRGILLRSGDKASSNTITLEKGHSGIYPQNGAIVQGNYVLSGAATHSIRADGGTSGILIIDNQVDKAVPASAGNTVRNNDLV